MGNKSYLLEWTQPADTHRIRAREKTICDWERNVDTTHKSKFLSTVVEWGKHPLSLPHNCMTKLIPVVWEMEKSQTFMMSKKKQKKKKEVKNKTNKSGEERERVVEEKLKRLIELMDPSRNIGP